MFYRFDNEGKDGDSTALLEFCPRTHPYLSSHALFDDEPILSAATLLRSIIQNTDCCQLQQITFFTSVHAYNKRLRLVRDEDALTVVAQSDNTVVVSAKVSKVNDNWKSASDELLSPSNFPLYSNQVNLVVAEKFYEFMQNAGYKHNDEFRSVHWLELRVCDDKAYGSVVLTPSEHLDCQLDGLWQGMVFALMSACEDASSSLLVPFCIRSLKITKWDEATTNWACSGRFVVDLYKNYGNFLLFDGTAEETLLIGEDLIFLPKSSDNKVNVDVDASEAAQIAGKVGIRSMSCRLPGDVKSPDDFWNLLKLNHSTDQRILASRIANRNELIRGQLYGNSVEGGNFIDENVALFDPALFGLSQNEAKAADPQQKLVLKCAYECLERAGLIVDDQTTLKRLGIFVGMMGSEHLDAAVENDALVMLGASASVMCGRLSHFFNSRGTSLVVDTACSSSLVALDIARSQLLDDRIEIALIVGINLILSEKAMGQRANGKLLSVDGRCKSFDAKADGYGRADGCVALLVERVRTGQQYEAVIEATNTNHDGRSAALTVPNGVSHAELIHDCINKVRSPKTIAFWECHGTGTALGDPIELNALQKALLANKDCLVKQVFLSTAKATIGHTEAASGLVGVMKSVLQLQHSEINPLPNFELLNPQIQLATNFKIPVQTVYLDANAELSCGVSSFGVGGTNACAILSKAREVKFQEQECPVFGIVPVAAKTRKSLQMMTATIKSAEFDEFLAPAMALYRRHYRYRTAFVIRGSELRQVGADGVESVKIRVEVSDRHESSTLWGKVGRCKQIYEQLTANAQAGYKAATSLVNVFVLLTYLKEVGLNRDLFDEGPFRTLLDLVYSQESINMSDLILTNIGNIRLVCEVNSRSESAFWVNSIEKLEQLIACVYIASAAEVRWASVYPETSEEFLLQVVKKLPTYAFDEVICWKSEQDWLAFDHGLLGNLVERGTEHFKLEGYLSDNRLPELFRKKHFSVGFIVEALASVIQHLRPYSTMHVHTWHHSGQVSVKQMWLHTTMEIKANSWLFHLLTDAQTICKASGSFVEVREVGNTANCLLIDKQVRSVFVSLGQRRNFLMAQTALLLDELLANVYLRPVTIHSDLTQITCYARDESGLAAYNQSSEVCASFELARTEALKETKRVRKESSLRTGQTVQSHKSNELAVRIAQILQRSVSEDIQLDESHYDTGFFDLGIDSLAIVGFANQFHEAQLPRLTSVEIIAHPTVNKLAAYVRQKVGLTCPTQCDSGYSSVINEEHLLNPRLSETIEQQKTVDIGQLIYRVAKIRNNPSCEFKVTFIVKGNDILILHDLNSKRFKLTFHMLAAKIAELKPPTVQLSFEMLNEQIDFTLICKLFIKLGNTLVDADRPVKIQVRNDGSPTSEMAMAFLKSVCAEHPALLSVQFHDRLRLITKEDLNDGKNLQLSDCWIITGGTSGIGWQLARHLLQKYSNISEVILIARRQPAQDVAREIMGFGERVKVMLSDLCNKQKLNEVVKKIAQRHNSVGIVHSAGIVDDVLLRSQTMQRFGRVFDAKCKGLLNLSATTKRFGLRVDRWILNSSVSSVLGNTGQSNYAAANAFLDSFAEMQVDQKVCSINWANWLEAGFAAAAPIAELLRKKGFYGLKTDEALRCFDWILEHPDHKQLFVARVDWSKMFEFRPELVDLVCLKKQNSDCLGQRESKSAEPDDGVPLSRANQHVQGIEQLIVSEVRSLLHLDPSEQIETTVGFMELGLDSFGMFNLSSRINRGYDQNLVSIIHLFEYSNISSLSRFVEEKLRLSDSSNLTNGAAESTSREREKTSPRKQEQRQAKEPALQGAAELEPMQGEQLSKDAVGSAGLFENTIKKPNLVFLFAGHGSLYHSVCVDLYTKVPYIQDQVRLCSQHFQQYLKMSIEELILHSKTDQVDSLPLEHAIIFTIGFALAKFWLHVGLEPTHMIGHSLGELVAVCVAGFVELEDAAYLVYLRAKALQKCKGAMMAVDSTFLASIDHFRLDVASINGPKQVVVSGCGKNIEKAMAKAVKQCLSTKIISNQHAFHSKLIKDKHLKHLHKFDWSKVHDRPAVKVISNLNAEPIAAYTLDYVKRHAKSTVQFWKSIDALLADGEMTVLEVGPGRVLSSLTQKILNERSLRYLVLNTIQKNQANELDSLKWSAQKLELKGFSINQRDFSHAIGEDFVKQVSSAFSSSFRISKSGSVNVRHHRVIYQRRLPSAEGTRRQLSVKDVDLTKQPDSNKQLVLHKRRVTIEQLDLKIISDHMLFGETIAPAAYQFKCFSDHLRLQQIRLHDVRLTSKLFVNDLDDLITVFNQGRLQLRQSGENERLFASCLVEVPKATDIAIKLSLDQVTSTQSPSVPAELDLCSTLDQPNKQNVSQPEVPDFPDSDPGILINPHKFYDKMSASGFHYDKHLRLLLDIRLIGLNRIRTRCQKPAASWILFDLAMQTLSAGLFDVRHTKCYVPVAIAEVYSKFPTDWDSDGEGQWTMHGEVTRREGEVVEGSVWIFARGVMIGHLKGIRAIRSLPSRVEKSTNKEKRMAISTDDELKDSTRNEDQKRKRRKSRSQRGQQQRTTNTTSDNYTKHTSFSSVASDLFESSCQKGSSTASKTALAIRTLKNTRFQKDLPLRLQNKFKTRDDELCLVVRGTFGQFATDEIDPLFESISQQSCTHNVFTLRQPKTDLDASFFGLTPKEAQFMDPAQRFLLEATQRSMESAGLKQMPKSCGVFIGSSSSDFAQKAFAELDDPSAYLMAGSNASALSGRLAHFLQTNGPCLTIDTACSSFHTALCVACDQLTKQRCSWALVGAVNVILNDKTTRVMQNSGMLSQTGRCATFDADADGFVRSEGYGVVLIEALSRSKVQTLRTDDVYVKGWAMGHTGGKSAGFLVPDPIAEASVMFDACLQSQLDLIECHGTGTSLGDPIEVEAIKHLLNSTNQTSKEVYLNSMKTHFGHCEAAAGAVSFLAMLKVIKNRRLPALRQFNRLNPNIRLAANMRLPTETLEGDFQRVLINSFGFTGTNASILLEKCSVLMNKKFNFTLPQASKISRCLFNRQYLWPFVDETKRFECRLSTYKLEFEDVGILLNQLVERAKTILYCGRKFTKQSISIGRLKSTAIRHLSNESMILIWSVNKKLAEQCSKVSRFMAHLKSSSYIDVVVPQSHASTALALIKTCIAERNFKNLRFYALDDSRLLLPRAQIDAFVLFGPTSSFQKCLITGGLGGIGRKLLEQLPVQHKIVIGRTSRECVDVPKGCTYYNYDVLEYTHLERLFRAEKNIDLVIHCAGGVQNGLLKEMSIKSFENLFTAKVRGTKNLLKLCQLYGARKMVVLSSIAAVFGSIGQANYSTANAEMDRLVGSSPIDCLSIVLGPVHDVGMLSGVEKQQIRQQIEANGWKMMSSDEVVDKIIRILDQSGQIIIVSSNEVEVKENVKFAELVKTEGSRNFDVKTIRTEVTRLLGEVSGLNDVPPGRGFMSLGIDSMMIEQLRERLCQHFEVKVTPAEMYEHSSLDRLLRFLKQKLALRASNDSILSIESSSNSDEVISSTQEDKPSSCKVAIIGFASELPNSNGADDFFEQLLDGKELFDKTNQEPDFVNVSSCLKDTHFFDATFFEVSAEDASLLDPQIRVLLRVANNVLVDAGYTQERRRSLRIACFTAAEPSEFSQFRSFSHGSLLEMYSKNQKDFISAWNSHLLGLNGPANSVYSACSSSLVALANAVQLLQTNPDVDLCLVGSINLVNKIGHQVEQGSPMATEAHCRPFSKHATGIIRGSGCGVILCKRLTDAIHDKDTILAIIRAIAVNNDANRVKSSFLAPSIQGQQEVIEQCLSLIGNSPLVYVECHATGTLVGDSTEVKALQNALQSASVQSRPYVGSVKANIGHAFAASGMVSLAKCLKILETCKIPPQINLEDEALLDEISASILKVNLAVVRMKIEASACVMINNFGIGGTNACLLLEKPAPIKRKAKLVLKKQVEKYSLLTVSARSAESCLKYCRKLADYLMAHSDTDLALLSNTLLNYRDQHEYRFATVVRTIDEAVRALENVDESRIQKARTERPFALYFCHQGLQYEHMLQLERQICNDFNQVYNDFVYDPDGNQTDNPATASSLLLGVFASVVAFLQKIGLSSPAVVFGHSFGEYGAMLTAGVFDYPQALQFVVRRGELFKKTRNAKMFAVQTDKDEIHESLHLSAVLSPTLRSFVCASESLSDAEQALDQQRFQWKKLRSEFGFHSSFMDPIMAEFFEIATTLQLNDSLKMPFISNVDGEVISKSSTITPNYLTQHLRQPVRLDLSLESLRTQFPDVDTIIEIGPSSVLASLLDHQHYRQIQTVQSFSENRHEPAPMLFEAIAKLWTLGFPLNLQELFGVSHQVLRGLPVYAFDEQHFAWPTKHSEEASREFQLYKLIWKFCKSLCPDDMCRSKKTVWVFTDSAEMCSSLINYKIFQVDKDPVGLPDATNSPDVVVHLCLKPSFDSTFSFLNSLHQLESRREVTLISCSLSGNSPQALSIGPLEELERLNSNFKTMHIFFDDLDVMISTLRERMDQLCSLSPTLVPRFRCVNNLLLQQDYSDEVGKLAEVRAEEVYLLIGGNGSLGTALVRYLTDSSSLPIVLSRSFENSQKNTHYYSADVTNRSALDEAIKEIRQKFGRLDCTIFLVGVKPQATMQKSRQEMETVIACKVTGLANLVSCARSNNLSLGSLVLCSSLSSVSGMPGIADYCSANCFLDHQAELEPPGNVVSNVVSVQLPPLRSSAMMVGEKSTALSGSLIELLEAAKWLVRMRKLSGTYALANVNPLQIRRFFINSIQASPVDRTQHVLVESAVKRLEKIWKSLLPVTSKFEPSDDFFSSGGNSLSALRLVWKIYDEFAVHVSMDKLISNSRFSKLCTLIDQTGSRHSRIQSLNRQRVELSMSQEQMWILSRISPPSTYNVVFRLDFHGDFDEVCALNAIKMLMKRHKMLRTRFFEEDAAVFQEVMPLSQAIQLSVLDQKNTPVEEIIAAERCHEFDLSKNTFRFIVTKFGSNYCILVNYQHIVVDGWSMTIFADEFSHFYRTSSKLELPPLEIDYLDYAQFSRQQFDEAKCREYANLLRQLSTVGTTLWPASGTSMSENSRSEVYLEANTLTELDALCTELSCTRFLLILTAFIRCLDVWRWRSAEGDEPIVVGCPSSGREYSEVSGLIGYFLNNMVVCVETRRCLQTMNLSELLNVVGAAVNRAQQFVDVPFHRVVSMLNQARSSNNYQPLFQIFFNYRHQLDFPTIDLGQNLSCTVEQLSNNNTFQLSCTVDELDAKVIKITLDCDGKSLDSQMVSSFAADLRNCIQKLRRVEQIDYDFVYRSPDDPSRTGAFCNVMQLFFDQCKLQSAAPALQRPNGEQVSYAELQAQVIRNSNCIRRELKECGKKVRSNTIVPILLDMNSAVEWILAVLICGCAYCPMDPNQPLLRTKAMIHQLESAFVISDQKMGDLRVLDVCEARTQDAGDDIPSPRFGEAADHAYVIFTSGSTGQPKAVCVQHAQLFNFVQRCWHEFDVSSGSVVAHSTNTVFDVSIFNIFVTLTRGGCLVQKSEILRFVEDKPSTRLTHLVLSSALFNSLKPNQLDSLRELTGWLLVGGETPSNEALRQAYHPHLRMSQFYGPTETTVWCSVKHYDNNDFDGQNIGTAWQSFFLTTVGRGLFVPLRAGSQAVGELWICGDQVARGYLKQPQDEFVENYLGVVKKAYRTGDLVRLVGNELHFLGRRDHRFKVNGIRFDPCEVESVMRKVGKLQQVLVTLIGDQLVAFVTDRIDDEATMKTMLAKELSGYMIPSRIVQLKNGFPLNRNGKINRQRVRDTYLAQLSTPKLAALKLTTQNERLLAEIWSETVGIPPDKPVESSSNFFEIGGHSLSVLSLQAAIKQKFAVELSFDLLYRFSNFADQVALIEERIDAPSDVIRPIRESPNAQALLYCIHAIGGTIYSYYSLATVWPVNCNIYAIAYQKSYPARSLKELAEFYHKQITSHAKVLKVPFLLLGHSLGGILAWEVANLCVKLTNFTPIVCAFDSWVVDNDKLDEKVILKYLQNRFETLQNRDHLVESALELCRMLKNHQMEPQAVPLHLFKAEKLGETALKHAIRKDLTEEMTSAQMDNGWMAFVGELSVYPCSTDHDSIMEPGALRQYLWLFSQLIDQTISN